MDKIHYNKLIADKVPENMEKLGKQFEVRQLSDDGEYEKALFDKVIEEAHELRTALSKESTMKEMVDVLEVIDAIKSLKKISDEELQAVKAARKEKRGGFLQRFFLLWGEDDGYEALKNRPDRT